MRRRHIAFAILLLLSLREALRAETVAIEAAADVSVDSTAPGSSLDGSLLRVGRDAPASGSPRYRTFLRFDLSSVPPGAAVSGAALRLSLQTLSGGGALAIDVGRVTSAWEEATTTWKAQPAAAAPIVPWVSGPAPGELQTVPVTPIVLAWRSGAPNHGFALVAHDEAGVNATRSFASSEHATATMRPRLVVTYTLAPEIDVAPLRLDFGGVAVGAESPALAVRAKNTGGAALSITTLASSDGRFRLDSPPALPATLAPGVELELRVRFRPTAAGDAEAELAIGSDDPDEPETRVALRGTGVVAGAPSLEVSPQRIDFEPTPAGSLSLPREVRLRNLGAVTLAVSSIAATSPAFAVRAVPPLPLALAPGAERTVQVAFAPTAAQPASASLRIASSDPARPQAEVPLTGVGTPSLAGDLALDPPLLDCGEVELGARSTVLQARLRNMGTSPLRLIRAAPSSGQFEVLNAAELPIDLVPNDVHELEVVFAPRRAGVATAQLLVQSSDPDRPVAGLSLRGKGTVAGPTGTAPRPFRRGDANQSGAIDISDAVSILAWLFSGGTTLPCPAAADVDGSDRIDITDAIFALQWLFLGAAAPPAPTRACGLEPGDASGLGCDASSCPPACEPTGPAPAAGAGAGLARETDTYTAYVQNVFLVPKAAIFIADPPTYAWPTMSDLARGAAIAQAILDDVDADIVVLDESFSDEGRLAIEAVFALDCALDPLDCYRTRVGLVDCICLDCGFQDSGLALYSKFPALRIGPPGAGELDFCLNIDLNPAPGVFIPFAVRTIPGKDFIRFHRFQNASGFEALSNKGVALVRLDNPVTHRPLDVYFSHLQSGNDEASEDFFEELTARLGQLAEVKGFVREHSLFAGGAPAGDVIFVGDFNVPGDAPGTPIDGLFNAGGDSEWQKAIGDTGADEEVAGDLAYAPLGEAGLIDAWWETCPVRDVSFTHTYPILGSDRLRLDYLMKSFLATPFSCVQHLVRHELVGDAIDDDWDLERALILPEDLGRAVLSDHFGLLATIGPRDVHCSPRSGPDVFDRDDEPTLDRPFHLRTYQGAFEDLASPARPGPEEASEVIAHRGGYHWYHFTFPGTYSFAVEGAAAMEMSFYLASDISRPLAPAQGRSQHDPASSCEARPVVAFAEPFYVRLEYAEPSESGVQYTFRAAHHDGSTYDRAILLTEDVEDASTLFQRLLPDTNERWYKLKVRKPTWTVEEGGAPQRITIPSINAASPGIPDSMTLAIDVFRDPDTDPPSAPGEEDRYEGTDVFLDGSVLPATLEPKVFEAVNLRTADWLVLRVAKRPEDPFPDEGPEPFVHVRWTTNLKTLTLLEVRCRKQCEDDDDVPFVDVQDDEVRLRFFVDGAGDPPGSPTYEKYLDGMDDDVVRSFPNIAPRMRSEAGEWTAWRTAEGSEETLFQLRGLTISYVERLEMEFWGIDDPDPDDNLGSVVWTSSEQTCPPSAWEGRDAEGEPTGLPRDTCDATSYFGGVEDCADREHAYVFRAAWSRSAPVERVVERR